MKLLPPEHRAFLRFERARLPDKLPFLAGSLILGVVTLQGQTQTGAVYLGAFHPLERIGGVMAGWLAGGSGATLKDLNFIGTVTKPVVAIGIRALEALPEPLGAFSAIAIGIGLVIGAVLALGKLLRSVVTGKAMGIVNRLPLAGGLRTGGFKTVDDGDEVLSEDGPQLDYRFVSPGYFPALVAESRRFIAAQ